MLAADAERAAEAEVHHVQHLVDRAALHDLDVLEHALGGRVQAVGITLQQIVHEAVALRRERIGWHRHHARRPSAGLARGRPAGAAARRLRADTLDEREAGGDREHARLDRD